MPPPSKVHSATLCISSLLIAMAMAQCLRGTQLLHAWGIERFPFLKEPKKRVQEEEPARFMQAEFAASSQYPKWAPRESL
jgi:hypothetical protein